jgi:GT2 family glycosyltransferase
MTPLVSAIVLNYRTGRDAWNCVQSLLRQTIADRMEVLVVDNHSSDDSIGYIRNRARACPSVRVIETPQNIGYGKGNTLGARLAAGEYILIINPDNELEPQGAERMVEKMRAESSIGILGPQLVHEDGTVRDSFRTFPTVTDLFIKRMAFLRRRFPERVRRYLQHGEDLSATRYVDWLAGACLLMRRDFFLQLEGFDPRFFLFFEDTDLCRRCWAAGKRVVYFPRVQARDRKHRLSEGGMWALFTKKTARIHLLSAIKYFWKWRGLSH